MEEQDRRILSEGARSVAERLSLRPHPEGGYYREIYRDLRTVIRPGISGGLSRPCGGKNDGEQDFEGARRSAVTVILFLIPRGEPTAWHRVDSTEIRHHAGGGALSLEIEETDKGATSSRTIRLGDPGDPDSLVGIVPAGAWQRARSEGEHSLVTCTVAPGFEFSDFTLRDA